MTLVIPLTFTPADRPDGIDLSDPDALVMPAFWHCPEYHVTIGPEAAELGRLFGRNPNPEQRLLLDGAFGMDRSGNPVVFETFTLASRQNLKTGFFEFRALAKALLLKRPVQIWTAHKESATDQALLDFKTMIDTSFELSRRIRRITEGKGSKSIEFVNGCVIVFRPRTGKTGQSMSADDVDLDEYFAIEPKHLGSLVPTMSTRKHAQIGAASSAPHAGSDQQRRMMARGRAAAEGRSTEPRLLYAEWSVQRRVGEAFDGSPIYGPPPCENPRCAHLLGTPGCIADKREYIKMSNPSAGRSAAPAIGWDFLADERRALDGDAIEEYFRERLGAGSEQVVGAGDAIRADIWLARTTDKEPPPPAALGLAIDVERVWGSIAASTVKEPQHLGSVLRVRLTEADLVGQTVQIAKKYQIPVAIDMGGPAGNLAPRIEEEGVRVVRAGFADFVQACSDLYDAIMAGSVEHGGYDDLNKAVSDATWRMANDRRLFARKHGEISMLEAATLARWAALQVVSAEPFALWGN